MTRPSITLAEVARLAGVSSAVASKVLNGGDGNVRVGDDTRQRILGVAGEQGYRRNLAAMAVRKGRFGSLSLVLSADVKGRSSVTPFLMNGITQALDQRNMHLSIANLPDEKLTSEGFVPRILREMMSDGLLVNYNKEIPARMISLIEDYHLPSIWLNCKRQNDCVHPDDFGAGYQAVKRLIELGHRRIAYLSYSYEHGLAHYSEIDRREGARAAMAEAGLTLQVEDIYQHSEDSRDRLVMARAFLSRPDRPTAVMVYGMTSVMPLVLAATSLGLAIPRDLSVITSNWEPLYLGVNLTTMVVPDYQVGRIGVAMMLEKLQHRNTPLAPRVAAFEWGHENSSVARPS